MLHTFWLMATPSSISNTTVSTVIVAIFCTLRSSDAGTYITARRGKWRELRWSISQVGLGGEAAEVEVWREVEGRALEVHVLHRLCGQHERGGEKMAGSCRRERNASLHDCIALFAFRCASIRK